MDISTQVESIIKKHGSLINASKETGIPAANLCRWRNRRGLSLTNYMKYKPLLDAASRKVKRAKN